MKLLEVKILIRKKYFQNSGYSLNEVKKNKYFWMMALGFTFVGIYVSAYSIQHAAYFQGFLKLDVSTIGTIGMVFAIFSLGGNIVGGFLFDKLGVIKCLIISSILVFISGVLLMLCGKSPIFAYIFSAIKGLAVYVYMMGPAYMTGSLFGNKDYGSKLGLVQLLFAVGFSFRICIIWSICREYGIQYFMDDNTRLCSFSICITYNIIYRNV